jgi:hypothetical protein
MDTMPSTTSYLSLRVDVPVRTAVAAFDHVLGLPECALAVDRVRLITSSELVHRIPVPRTPSYVAYRSVHGLLLAPHIRRRVELELAPWSRDATELGLRPTGRASRSATDPVVSHGYRLLTHLRDVIHFWADQPLRRMTTTTSTAPVDGLTRCYVLLQADPGVVGEIVQQARALPTVADATATTGSYDVFVQAAGDGAVIRQLPEQLRRLPGVTRVLICLPK